MIDQGSQESVPRRYVPSAEKIAFVAACCSVVAVNLFILHIEGQADAKISTIEQAVNERLARTNPTTLVTLLSNAISAERRLISLEVARPVSVLGSAEDRVRGLKKDANALAAALAEVNQDPASSGVSVSTVPRIVYANYDTIDEIFELCGPPNTLRNPATYTFATRYGSDLFPEIAFPEIARGQVAGAYKLLNVNVETRLGEVVKDKVVRHRRRKGGVREPVWSYKRLPSRQVVVLRIAHLKDGTEHNLHYPADGRGESRAARTQIPVAWIERRENENETKSQFPVMEGSVFSWGGSIYFVTKISPQELKLETREPPAKHVWLLGAGP